MTVSVELSLSSDSFLLGRLFSLETGMRVEFCRTVPTVEGMFPLFWLLPADADGVPARLRDRDETESLTRLAASHGLALYAATWDLTGDGLVGAILETDGAVVGATGTATTWSFHLVFWSRSDLHRFHRTCRADGVDVQVHRVRDAVPDTERGPLSDEQWTALVEGYHHGYFDVPRGITQQELAEVLGVSDSAVSQRLRRGIAALVADSLHAADRSGDGDHSHGVGGGPS